MKTMNHERKLPALTRRLAGLCRRLPAALVATFLGAACSQMPTTHHDASTATTHGPAVAIHDWVALETEPYRGKQDDIFFVTPETGWYVNGSGKIFKTVDGGRTWVKKLDQPGTYFRCIGFIDERRGFAGNIGPGYFPGVTDPTPLYETRDGGDTWTPVKTIKGDPVTGLCAIFISKTPFINAGKLDHKVRVFAAGRVGGPAVLLRSDDAGESWVATDMSADAGMIFDVEFTNANTGIISAASHASVAESNALILRTTDGGATWQKVYQSDRPYETTWKSSFPSRNVGYVTVQSYDPDKSRTRRVVAKTIDGGRTWSELLLTSDHAVREFGIGFIDEKRGWVGTTTSGFETLDGGATWTPVEMGRAVNKIRLVRDRDGFVGYAIGVGVHKLDHRARAANGTRASDAARE